MRIFVFSMSFSLFGDQLWLHSLHAQNKKWKCFSFSLGFLLNFSAFLFLKKKWLSLIILLTINKRQTWQWNVYALYRCTCLLSPWVEPPQCCGEIWRPSLNQLQHVGEPVRRNGLGGYKRRHRFRASQPFNVGRGQANRMGHLSLVLLQPISR